MPDYNYSESALIEQPAIELFQFLGYSYQGCFHEIFGEKGTLGRETSTDVILITRLRQTLLNLNPDLPNEAIEQAIEELTRDRSLLNPANANKEIYKLIRDGVEVQGTTLTPSLSQREKAGENKTVAAQILGIDRVSLWRKLKRYGLETD